MPEKNTQTEFFNRDKVRFLSGLSFVGGFLDAFLLYILSSYFANLSGESFVGGFYLIVYVVMLFGLTELQPLLHRIGSVPLLLFLYLVLIGCSFSLSLSGPTWMGAAVLLLFLIANNLIGPINDIILEDFSSDMVSGRIRGLYLTVLNAGLLFAPFVSTWTLTEHGYSGVFAVTTVGYSLMLVATLLGLRHHRTKSPVKISFVTTLKKVFQRKNLLYIYTISWVLEFFYVVMIVYTPILLRSYGYDWTEIGLIFTIMLIPFILIQYPLGVLADKHWGEKELLLASLILMAVTTALVAVAGARSLLFWALLLFATRVGAAGIEILRDSYFYKQITRADADIVAFFRTARSTANIFAAVTGLFFLSLFPLPGLFLIVALFTGAACLSALWLPDSRPGQA